ncbi:DNA polymerase III subunit gamma/tau [Rhodobacteraceae bacterium N5(2021)]|uniref:DNA polymerase III subunit gamma/tau n=1 Tax=Gymnodinialimonas phycosphaerae TaxID=2841589 RepID=A0A975YEK7_9RHOB|nr:DNA polymerase III subunit gamma/tau [Gymnodinialimonas phycosphaerae]MBY4893739.1 DNA polymerase III subunit gamma/tau [Gymnodinialimonas phycosphaerae]
MTETPEKGYQVLARKYRPATFADLIGQEAMVRTLKNAFDADRIAQAFMLTGIRGTGKTTTARIIAKGLNCIGADGEGGPTTDPCGVCQNCVAITEGRHVDVMEMDAASNTGVQNIRDAIIETVSYRAAQARYKIFIIDEVHMLSTSAFNALLKTLEEPPAHVKFLFATTEIRKVPVTVLSRCQRFDLRRIEPEVMIAHLQRIAGLENAEIAEDALALITRAAEGSVRDAMSLLDQAIAHGAGETTADQVRAMLGLADRGRVLDLFEAIMKGDAAKALDELGAQYADGADPVAVLRDLAEITHWLSVISITPDAAEDPTISPDERTRGLALASSLPMRVLTRMWQMLLKALEEVAMAPNAMMAAEMAVIRLTHVADLPTPGDLVKKLAETPRPSGSAPSGGGGQSPVGAGPTARVSGPASMGGGGPQAAVAMQTGPDLSAYPTFESLVALIESARDIKLLIEVKTALRLVSYAPGRLEVEVTDAAPRDLIQRLGRMLHTATGVRWGISVTSSGGAATIQEQEQAAAREVEAEVTKHPLMQAVLARFPQARIAEIRSHADLEQEAAATALEEIPEEADDWDPFEDE